MKLHRGIVVFCVICCLVVTECNYDYTKIKQRTDYDFSQDFWKAFNSIPGAGLRSEIFFGILQSDTLRREENDYSECYPRLLHEMGDNLKCPRAAHELRPLLEIMSFWLNMTMNKTYVQSWMEKNCSYFEGRTKSICQLVLTRGSANVRYKLFLNVTSSCQFEHLQLMEIGNGSLSAGSAFSINF